MLIRPFLTWGPRPSDYSSESYDDYRWILNNMSKTDVAPWCYKWVDWMDGLDVNLRVRVCIEHLTVLISQNILASIWRAHFNLFSKFLQFTLKITSNLYHGLKSVVCTIHLISISKKDQNWLLQFIIIRIKALQHHNATQSNSHKAHNSYRYMNAIMLQCKNLMQLFFLYERDARVLDQYYHNNFYIPDHNFLNNHTFAYHLVDPQSSLVPPSPSLEDRLQVLEVLIITIV